jgi:hypothetical protein
MDLSLRRRRESWLLGTLTREELELSAIVAAGILARLPFADYVLGLVTPRLTERVTRE